ncbi:Putative peroxiredoxin in rubredoxin operon (fragment) [uncultured Desulfatiglans sp.]
MGACVGAPAPDFEASAYDKGSVTKIVLGDYRGQWVVLFFYPADFTCV